MADLTAEAAKSAGLAPEQIIQSESHVALAKSLRNRIHKGDRVLVKGSRAAQMERVIELLEEGSP